MGRESEGFDYDEVVVQTRLFIDAWQKEQWARLVPLIPPQLIGTKSPGEAAKYAKSWFEMHKVSDIEVERIDYTQSGVAETRGTIDDTTSNLRLRWVRYDEEENLALNHEHGSWLQQSSG